MTKRHAVAAAFFAVLVVLAGACSSNSAQVQDKIAEQIKKETGVSDAKVTCPKDIKANKGETFTCDAEGNFGPYLQSQGVNAQLNRLRFKVTFVDDKSFSAEVDTVQLQADLSSQNSGATASTSSSDSTATDSSSTDSSSSDNPALTDSST
ncbi:MAG TPA: DUF4333 domain-containing protein [Acidimicrobiales bacterium]|nr:DUF4333 domain-containing protein [Acidimicrobiales bacterium]